MPLLKPGKTLRFMGLPSGEDPDSLVQSRGADGFRHLLDNARQLADVVWQTEIAAARHDTPERRADLERRVNQRISGIADDGVKYHYQQSFRQRLRDLFFQPRGGAGFKGAKGGNWGKKKPELAPGLGARGDIGAMKAMQERALVATLINHPDLIHDSIEALNEISLQSRELDTLLQVILNLAFTAPVLDTRDLQRHLNDDGYERLLGDVLHAQVYRKASFAGPEATVTEARAALDEMLQRYGRGRMVADRAEAKKELADDMSEPNSNKLLNLVREESGAGSL
jgi:DNA primase